MTPVLEDVAPTPSPVAEALTVLDDVQSSIQDLQKKLKHAYETTCSYHFFGEEEKRICLEKSKLL